MNLEQYRFGDPHLFWLFIIIPFLIFWYVYYLNKKLPEQKITTLSPFSATARSAKEMLRHMLFALRLLAVILIIIALARPQKSLDKTKTTSEGIDIVLALDISSSMLAKDFKPDRLEAAKSVAIDFIKGRPNDRIGLVTFAAESYTQCPITTDHTILINLLQGIKSGILQDGTAIGLGLATSTDRLKESPCKSKVIILLTDGMNNSGFINPITAAEIAKKFNIRVYTIGVGTIGTAPYPVQTPFGIQYQQMEVQIDEPLLKQIADMTGVKYYRATNNEKLIAIYNEIDKLEKAKIEVSSYHRFNDKFIYFIFLAFILLVTESILRYTYFRYFP
jgi:Ca-activated chloride channel family protein